MAKTRIKTFRRNSRRKRNTQRKIRGGGDPKREVIVGNVEIIGHLSEYDNKNIRSALKSLLEDCKNRAECEKVVQNYIISLYKKFSTQTDKISDDYIKDLLRWCWDLINDNETKLDNRLLFGTGKTRFQLYADEEAAQKKKLEIRQQQQAELKRWKQQRLEDDISDSSYLTKNEGVTRKSLGLWR